MRSTLTLLYRSLLPIFLLGVFLYMLSGYYVLYEVKRQAVRREIGTRLSEHSLTLTVLTIPDSQASQVTSEGAHEIIIGGHLYDIFRTVRSEGVTKYYCFHDRQEEHLAEGLRKASGGQLPAAIAQLLDVTALPPDLPAPEPRLSRKVLFAEYIPDLPSRIPHPATPPPKHALSA